MFHFARNVSLYARNAACLFKYSQLSMQKSRQVSLPGFLIQYLFYKQTHTLNTKEMAQLIDGVVRECHEAGIETYTEEEIESICQFLAPYAGNISYELLGFHTLGFPKYDSLGMPNELKETKGDLPKKRLNTLKKMLAKYHFKS